MAVGAGTGTASSVRPKGDLGVKDDRIAAANPSLSLAIEKARETRLGIGAGEASAKIENRKTMMEDSKGDPNGYERILGASDLNSINYLDRGRRAAAAVCRIAIPGPAGTTYGTGFIVAPGLLITNNHVISEVTQAAQAEAQFEYEHDIEGVVKPAIGFNLVPNEIFFTSKQMDFTFVAIAPFSNEGVPLERYGRLPLIPLTGKVVNAEYVSIIQHPQGQPKQIAIRASQIVELAQKDVKDLDLKRFIHYTTDTEPGSSGSPVLNDQWQVIALHHKAVPAPGQGKNPVDWIANEGVRVSAIFERLERSRFESSHANEVLNRLSGSLGFPPVQPTLEIQNEQYAPYDAAKWAKQAKAIKLGYDPAFHGVGGKSGIDLKKIIKPMLDVAAPLLDGSGHILDYFHFSVVMHKDRRFPLITAVNIDGSKLVHPGKREDTWRPDARIALEHQSDDVFYKKSLADEKVYFSRGHLVRLLDPCWGDNKEDARLGMEHSFHFTNAAPQFQAYNDADWGNLEDYLLDQAQTSEKKLTVFTGPIFRENDPRYGAKRKGGPWRIPMSYWKIALLQKGSKMVSAAAFIVGQTEYVRALYEEKVFSGLKPYSLQDIRSRKIQTSIAAIEKETGLDFGAIRKFDQKGAQESTRQTEWLRSLNDIEI